MGALAYRIIDTEATGAIIVSPLGLQRGAEIIAKAENIHKILLTPESTTTDYLMEFMEKTFLGFSETVTISDSVKIMEFSSEEDARAYLKRRREEAERKNQEAERARRKEVL